MAGVRNLEPEHTEHFVRGAASIGPLARSLAGFYGADTFYRVIGTAPRPR